MTNNLTDWINICHLNNRIVMNFFAKGQNSLLANNIKYNFYFLI